jgi:hypothetical protein
MCIAYAHKRKPSTAAGITATTPGSGGYAGAAARSLEGEDQAPKVKTTSQNMTSKGIWILN